MALEDQPAALVGSVCAIVDKAVVSDPDRWEVTLLELETAARAALAAALGRPATSTGYTVGVLYGCIEDGSFRPFPCPEATHARVTVRLVEE